MFGWLTRYATLLTVAGVAAALALSHWWVWRTAERHGRQAVQIEVQEAREALQVELYRQAQISRQAAIQIRAAEMARDRATQEALDALTPDDRRIGITPRGLELLRSIQ